MPYSRPDEVHRPARNVALHAGVVLGSSVLAAAAVIVTAGFALSRLGFDGLSIPDPTLENLPPGFAEPDWQTLRAVDVTTGATLWTRPLDARDANALEEFQSVRALDGADHLVLGRTTVRSEDRTTGAVHWSVDLHRPVLGVGRPAGPVVGVAVVDGEDSTLTGTVFLEVTTGRAAWETPSGLLSSFAYDPTTAVLYEYGQDQALLARDPRDGTVRWSIDRHFGRLYAAGGTVWVAGGGRLIAYDGTTGAWRSETLLTSGEARPVAVIGTTAVLAELAQVPSLPYDDRRRERP